MIFSTKECAWSQTSFTVLGRKLTGIRGFEIKKTIEKEHLYAAGSQPIDIQDGNRKYEGNIRILKYELDMLNEAALLAGFQDIAEVPHTLITVTCEYRKLISDQPKTIVVPGLGFTEITVAMEQNAKFTEITLPFLAMGMQHVAKAG